MRELNLSYLGKVEEEATKFLTHRIKHDYLRPGKELTLNLTLAEAEILASANPSVIESAEKGELAKIHQKFEELDKRIEGDYLEARNHLSKILYQIEEKENALYTQLEELGIEKVRKHG